MGINSHILGIKDVIIININILYNSTLSNKKQTKPHPFLLFPFHFFELVIAVKIPEITAHELPKKKATNRSSFFLDFVIHGL